MTESEILEEAASCAPMHIGTSAYRKQWTKAFAAGAQFAMHKLNAENSEMRAAIESFLRLNDSIGENPGYVGEEWEISVERLRAALEGK